ncbi:uncharacterized protein PAC_18686 [Phialocephala subalpina]|uniref:Azaphilone pigments biosynthesis cluster protein L N-terminal domain-containing protein n=1 Tax=Phialocephala subalpina TaxID=576137 RepID=A0A1L7XUX5_9HELO|nr:uncharacterized protein PAC_18686 [Phialocephala subalpina]
MSDPLSITAGVLALTLLAFNSGTGLYQLVDSFRSNQRIVRELRGELEALNDVLRSLQETVASTDIDLTALKLPLFRCGKACKDFETVIIRCTAHSSKTRTSFRDWAKIKYMGDDIAGFKNMLAGYKSTISIALGNANMRTAAITTNVLRQYKEMILNTTSDLEGHLENIDNKLQAICIQSTEISYKDNVERQQIQEERDGTQQCLDICKQVLTQIDQVQPNFFVDLSSTYVLPITMLSSLTSAQQLTSQTVKACKERLTAAKRERIQEERDAIKQGLDICADALGQANEEKTNVYEDIASSDDSHQVIISTVGALISARRVTGGSRTFQVLGQISDESFQIFSSRVGTEKSLEPQTRVDPEFEGRYGTGIKLSVPNSKGNRTTSS